MFSYQTEAIMNIVIIFYSKSNTAYRYMYINTNCIEPSILWIIPKQYYCKYYLSFSDICTNDRQLHQVYLQLVLKNINNYIFISYNYLCYQCLSPLTLRVRIPLSRGVLDTKLCDKVWQWLAAGRWFSLVSSTNKTDRHDITEILLKVALNTIHQTYNF
jgi:hypothetical protein